MHVVDFLVGQNGIELDAVDHDGCTALHSASFKGHVGCVDRMIAGGANVNFCDVDKSTPLHKACFSGSYECVTSLLRNGAQVQACDVDGVNALHKASFNNHASCVKALLEAGASLADKDKHGSTALHKAAYSCSLDALQTLVAAGAERSVFDAEGHTPLHLSCHKSHAEGVRILLEGSKDLVNARSEQGTMDTALHVACKVGSAECVKLLLAAHANVDVRNRDGKTALEIAKSLNRDAIVALLETEAKGKDDAAATGNANSNEAVGSGDDNNNNDTEAGKPLPKLDRWGFIGSEELTKLELEHKQKEVLREIKWVEMRTQWDKFMQRRFSKIRSRCLKGIPDSMRSFAWVQLSGAAVLRKEKGPNVFNELVARKEPTPALEIINRDLHRTFPDHVQFRHMAGKSSLLRVLKAYSYYNPAIGYCQGMGFVAALFLMYCVEEEDAFWMLVQMVDKYGMGGFWDKDLTDVPKMCQVHSRLLAKFVPRVAAHLEAEQISGALYAPSFYITGFTYCLPWPCVLRVWDAFLVEGMPVLHAVGVALLSMYEKAILELNFEKLMTFLLFNHSSSNFDENGNPLVHIDHVELADRLLKWLPKVKKPAAAFERAYVPNPRRKKE